jgi:hypothetical protein
MNHNLHTNIDMIFLNFNLLLLFLLLSLNQTLLLGVDAHQVELL